MNKIFVRLLRYLFRTAGIELLQTGRTKAHISFSITCSFKDFNEHFCFIVDNQHDLIQREHLSGRLYEAEELAVIGRHLAEGATVLDVGANVGNHAIYFAKCLGAARVIAVEPGRRQCRLLRYNVDLNGVEDVVEVHRVALSDHSGTGTLVLENPWNLGSAHLSYSEAGDEVPLLRGDDLLGEKNIDFIKIDAEKHEMEVLRGLSQIFETCRPPLFVEIETSNAEAFDEWLRHNRYTVAQRHARYSGIVNILAKPVEA